MYPVRSHHGASPYRKVAKSPSYSIAELCASDQDTRDTGSRGKRAQRSTDKGNDDASDNGDPVEWSSPETADDSRISASLRDRKGKIIMFYILLATSNMTEVEGLVLYEAKSVLCLSLFS